MANAQKLKNQKFEQPIVKYKSKGLSKNNITRTTFSPEVSLQMFASKIFSPEVSLQIFSSKICLQKFLCKCFLLGLFLQKFLCKCFLRRIFLQKFLGKVFFEFYSPEVSLQMFASIFFSRCFSADIFFE